MLWVDGLRSEDSVVSLELGKLCNNESRIVEAIETIVDALAIETEDSVLVWDLARHVDEAGVASKACIADELLTVLVDKS